MAMCRKIVKTGTQSPDPVTGLEFPVPECLNRLREVADVVVAEDEREETILRAIPAATILMTTYGVEVLRHVTEFLDGRDSAIHSSDPRLQGQAGRVYPVQGPIPGSMQPP